MGLFCRGFEMCVSEISASTLVQWRLMEFPDIHSMGKTSFKKWFSV